MESRFLIVEFEDELEDVGLGSVRDEVFGCVEKGMLAALKAVFRCVSRALVAVTAESCFRNSMMGRRRG